MRDLFVVISGAPGAGKTTLARPLAAALDLPLIEKDTIKEALGDVLGAADMAASKRLGAATLHVMYALARVNRGALLESAWEPALAREELARLPGPIIEVFCDVSPEVAQQRYAARTGTRHVVHFDAEQAGNLQGWVDRHPQVIDGGWPVVKVDTTRPVDVDALAEQILGL
jgi:predicted kinase